MSFARKVDSNHAAIAALLRQVGCSVLDLSKVGHGCPDLLCAVNGTDFLVEVKDGDKSPSRRELTPDQKQFHASWKGKLHTVISAEQALDLVAHYRKR
jgi:hypothetical protein